MPNTFISACGNVHVQQQHRQDASDMIAASSGPNTRYSTSDVYRGQLQVASEARGSMALYRSSKFSVHCGPDGSSAPKVFNGIVSIPFQQSRQLGRLMPGHHPLDGPATPVPAAGVYHAEPTRSVCAAGLAVAPRLVACGCGHAQPALFALPQLPAWPLLQPSLLPAAGPPAAATAFVGQPRRQGPVRKVMAWDDSVCANICTCQ